MVLPAGRGRGGSRHSAATGDLPHHVDAASDGVPGRPRLRVGLRDRRLRLVRSVGHPRVAAAEPAPAVKRDRSVEGDTAEIVTFDGAAFARAWLTAAIASGSDTERPALCNTVAIEFHRTGVRLVATDSYVLLTAWVTDYEHDEDADPPRMATTPASTVVAVDPHGRMRGLMKHIRKLTKGQEASDVDPVPVTIRVVQAAEPGQLSADLAPVSIIVEIAGRERLVLGTYEGSFPTWRPLLTRHKPEPTGRLTVTPTAFLRLGELSALYGKTAVVLTYAGEHGPVLVDLDPTLRAYHVRGLAMPARLPDLASLAFTWKCARSFSDMNLTRSGIWNCTVTSLGPRRATSATNVTTAPW